MGPADVPVLPDLVAAPAARLFVERTPGAGLDDDGHAIDCSCCGIPAARVVHVMVERRAPSGKQNNMRYCEKCVRAFAAAQVVGREVKRSRNGLRLTIKRWVQKGGEPDFCGCVLHPTRDSIGEMVAIHANGGMGVFCVPCVEAMAAVFGLNARSTAQAGG